MFFDDPRWHALRGEVGVAEAEHLGWWRVGQKLAKVVGDRGSVTAASVEDGSEESMLECILVSNVAIPGGSRFPEVAEVDVSGKVTAGPIFSDL
jgi:hypothetical protein